MTNDTADTMTCENCNAEVVELNYTQPTMGYSYWGCDACHERHNRYTHCRDKGWVRISRPPRAKPR